MSKHQANLLLLTELLHCLSHLPSLLYLPLTKLAYVVKPDKGDLLITLISSSTAHSNRSLPITVTLAGYPEG